MFTVLLLSAFGVVAPVFGPVVEQFRAPACERCAGHRGVTIATTPGDVVRAAVDGEIVFVGEVAGVTYVVERISADVRITYGMVQPLSTLVTGQLVVAGQPLGVSETRVYLGVRVGARPVHPLRYLGLAGARLVSSSRLLGVTRTRSR
jgi:murein DD-endopeptidase MepM/ murein hydrolase activator NlpD